MDETTPPLDYRFADWCYEPASRRLIGADGSETRVKPLTDRLLRRLLDAPGTVLSRERLIEDVWTRREVNDEVLSRAIAELRSLLGDDARTPRFVETLAKGGYRWIAAVERTGSTPAALAEALEGAGPCEAMATRQPQAPRQRARLPFAIGAALALAVALGVVAMRPRVSGDADTTSTAAGLLEARPLTADPRLEYDARFDPSGRVAYIRGDDASHTTELVLLDPTSHAERVLWTEDSANLGNPAPSPDGREIAVLRVTKERCDVWSVAVVDARRSRLAECAPGIATGVEWLDGGRAILYTGAALDPTHAPGLVRLDRADATTQRLTTPDLAEGAHVDPRLSPDGTHLAYASEHAGERQVWLADWPSLSRRTPLLKRSEPVYGHAFDPRGEMLWIAGDLTLYRALHLLRPGSEPELVGGRGALSIDVAPGGAAVWSEANFDADIWLRDRAGAEWTAIARSNRYESQPAFSPDGVLVALTSNRGGSESVIVHDRRDGSDRALRLDPAFRWVRPTWSLRDDSLLLTAYEERTTRLYRYRLDDDRPLPLAGVGADAFHGTELPDRLLYLEGRTLGRSRLMQRLDPGKAATDTGLGNVTAYRASSNWLVWRTHDSSALRTAPLPALQPVHEIDVDDGGESFALTGDVLTYVDKRTLWSMRLPHGDPVPIDTDRVPNGNGPNVAASADGALAVTTLTSLGIDLMLAEHASRPRDAP